MKVANVEGRQSPSRGLAFLLALDQASDQVQVITQKYLTSWPAAGSFPGSLGKTAKIAKPTWRAI